MMDPKHRASVARVETGSAADRAGLRAGDELVAVDGQPLVSIADIQWVLHHAGEKGSLAISLRRNGELAESTLSLEPGWRTRGDISWRATSWALRRMTTGGLLLEDLGKDQRTERGLGEADLALVVKHVGEYGEHAHAKQQGFLRGDILVSVAGHSDRLRESDLFALLVNKPAGERVPITVLRGQEKVDLSLMMQK
jgi:S1-C subfamily serine protease